MQQRAVQGLVDDAGQYCRRRGQARAAKLGREHLPGEQDHQGRRQARQPITVDQGQGMTAEGGGKKACGDHGWTLSQKVPGGISLAPPARSVPPVSVSKENRILAAHDMRRLALRCQMGEEGAQPRRFQRFVEQVEAGAADRFLDFVAAAGGQNDARDRSAIDGAE